MSKKNNEVKAEDILTALVFILAIPLFLGIILVDYNYLWVPTCLFTAFWSGAIICHILLMRFKSNRDEDQSYTIKNGEIRVFPKQDIRVESGQIQFGDDWPGIFLRGDTAYAYALSLSSILDSISDEDNFLHKSILRGLEFDLKSCLVRSDNGKKE